jgi:hypothetical protein
MKKDDKYCALHPVRGNQNQKLKNYGVDIKNASKSIRRIFVLSDFIEGPATMQSHKTNWIAVQANRSRGTAQTARIIGEIDSCSLRRFASLGCLPSSNSASVLIAALRAFSTLILGKVPNLILSGLPL